MWSDHRKLDDQDELVKALVEAGLPATELGTLMQDSEVKQTLVDNTTRAVERGAFGSPTFFVNDEIYFGKDRLRDVEEAIEKAKSA
jgi:2-hydroxychromene-2-carboxylate isomerase